MRFLKKLKSKISGKLLSLFVSFYDLRSTSNAAHILTPSTYYTPDFSKIHSEQYFWRNFDNVKLDPLFIKEFKQAVIVGNGIVVTSRGHVVLESTIFQKEYFFKLHQTHLLLTRFVKSAIKPGKNLLSLSTLLEDNYYHWIMETLTRVLLAEDAADLSDTLVILNGSGKSFKAESLSFLFGIKEQNTIRKGDKEIYSSNVVVPSFTHTRNIETKMTDICHPTIIRRLNERAGKVAGKSGKAGMDRIIVSRKNSTDRRILNENFLVEQLKGKGFQVVNCEDLPFIEQLNLFHGLQIVIGTHGAGLTNIVFARHALVIELFPSDRNPRDAFVFTQISAALGHEHHIISYSPASATQDVQIDFTILEKINAILGRSNI